MAKSILSQSGIYAIRNKINGMVYIGSTVKFSMRFATHRYKLNNGVTSNRKLLESWSEYGSHAFEFVILIICGKENLKYYEQRTIDIYQSVSDGFNISPDAASNIGVKATDETKKKMSLAHMGNDRCLGKKLSVEVRAKISASLIGNKRCLGHKASDEARARMSAASKGKPKSEQARINMRNALILRHQRAREAKNNPT